MKATNEPKLTEIAIKAIAAPIFKRRMYKMMVGKSASSAAGVVDGAVSSVVAGAGAGAGAGASLLGVSHEGVDTMIFCFLNETEKEFRMA